MAVTRRRGGPSFLIIGRQPRYGTPVKNFAETVTGISIDLATSTAGTIPKDADATDAGIVKLTAPANAIGNITVSGKDVDGNTVTEAITWENAIAPRAQATTQRFARNADITLTPSDMTGKTGTLTDVILVYMIQKRVPFTRLTLGGDSEQSRSDSIVGGGSDTLNISGQKGASGILEAEILPEDIIHLLRGLLNPNADPTSTKLAVEPIKAAATTSLYSDTQNPVAFTPDAAHAAYPSQVKATFSGAPTLGSTAKMIITGFRKIGRPEVEQYPVTETVRIPSADAPVFSNRFFTKIQSVFLEGVNGGTVQLDFEPDTYKSVIKLNTRNLLFPGWTFQENIGGMPVIANNVIPNSAEITIGTNIRILINLIASQVTNRRMLHQPHVERLVYNRDDDNNIVLPSAELTHFPVGDLHFYPNWGGALLYGEDTDPTAFTNLTMGINHNYEPSDGYTGSRFRGEPIASDDAIRQVTLAWTGFFEAGDKTTDTFHRWQEYYDDNTTAPVALNMFNYLDNGRQYRIELRGAQFQLTEEPTLPVETRGQIPRRIVGKIVPSEGAIDPDEIIVNVWSKKAYTEAALPVAS